ncbi:MAG: beta-lactamase family protein [Oscillospiraceae bacterium]|jgi:CubicO group peptidase (beta-lactamase class C family)|nr:beta-lactamase family protein [Oscillospiraceae bacterium]
MGLQKSLLDQFRLSNAEQNLGVYGIHVYKAGEGEVEHRFFADDVINVYSCSKTFTSIGVGICQDDGLIDINDPLLKYFPEYESVASPGSEAITLRDLLHMAAGKDFARFDEEEEKSMDLAEAFFRRPMIHKAGEFFFYCSPATYMLGRVVEKVSGKILRDFLMPRLFEPFGIHNPQWQMCPRGHTLSAAGLQLKTSQLAKIGRLMLHKGEYEGKRIVSAGYIDKMHTDVVDNGHYNNDAESTCGYGYQVWRCTTPGTYRADGLYGQFSIVLPQQNAVVSTTSHNEKRANDIVRAIFSDIVPQL